MLTKIKLMHRFKVKLYRRALLYIAKRLIEHDKKYGGRHIDDIKGTTFIPVDKKGYFFDYRLYRADYVRKGKIIEFTPKRGIL